MLCSRPGTLRPPFVCVLLLVLIASGCADEAGPAGPTLRQDPLPVGATTVDDLIVDLFDGGHRTAAQARVRNIRRQYARGQTEDAEGQMFDLIAWTLERQEQGQVQDPNGGSPPTTEEAVASFIGELFTLVGLPVLQIPPEALEPGGAAVIVDETGGTVTPEDPVVGVQVPPGAFSGPTLVTIAPLPPAFPPLPTGLTQFLPYYDINASSQPVTDVVIGICYFDDPPDAGGVPVGFPASRLRIAHPDPANPQQLEILPVAPVPASLSCATGPVPSVSPSQASVFPALEWAGSKLGRAVSRVLGLEASATRAVMADRGLGGSLRSFSPFAVVDIQSGGSISIVSGNAQVAPNGTTLPNATVVEVLDAVGLPLPGVSVQFTIQSVYGLGSDGTFVPTGAVTNASGQAQTSWTLSAGGEANIGSAAVAGFSAPAAVLGACGTFVGNSLNAFVQSYDANTGAVTINGGDWRRPIGSGVPPFRFDWGDGSPPTDSFFAASHTYANTTQNYTVTVTATYCDGTTDVVSTIVPFTVSAVTTCSLTLANLGDQVSRGFYHPALPASTLNQVDLWLGVSGGNLDPAGIYTMSLTARAGDYGGTVIGTNQQVLNLAAGVSSLASFVFPGPAVTPSSTVAFELSIVSGPGSIVFYQVPANDPSCPIVQTNGTTPPLDTFRRQGVRATIYGLPTAPPIP